MPRVLSLAALLATAAAFCASLPSRTQALTACTAADIIAQDASNCPSGTGPCTIKKDFDIPTGCVLDFGTRAVTLANLAVLDIGSGAATIKAGAFTVAAGGFIDGKGLGSTPPNDTGGALTIQTTGAVTVDSGLNTGRIDVSGANVAGSVTITAGTTLTVKGRILADSLGTADGGYIDLTSGGDIVTDPTSELSAVGAGGGSGGSVYLTTSGSVDARGPIDLDGYDGGSLDIAADGAVVLGAVFAKGTGAGSGPDAESGLGGTVDVVAGTTVGVVGQVGAIGTAGGCGGCVTLMSDHGDITVSDNILAEGGLPEVADFGAGGGVATLSAAGSIIVSATGRVSARSDGSLGFGGSVCLEATRAITATGPLDASGGLCGGTIDAVAAGAVTLAGPVDGSGRNPGGFGGTITVTAGDQGLGPLAIDNTVNVTGGGCSVESGCGVGGSAFLEGCDITVSSLGSVDARAPDGGGHTSLTAREQITVIGPVRADATGSGTHGTHEFDFPSRKPPNLAAGQVVPAPTLAPHETCTAWNVPAMCLQACPTCGDGAVDYPETCDNDPASCDGCSPFCRIENCDDNFDCTADSCDSALGCRHVLQLPCNTYTPAPTPTSTPTPTPSQSPLPTSTPTLAAYSLDGSVRYNNSNAPVPAATVTIAGTLTSGTHTASTGAFAFAAVPAGTVTIEPLKTGDQRNGISALDASYVLQRVVGTRTFSAAQTLACDVTGNGSISALDASRILQYVVGQLTRFDVANNCGSDWVFFPNPAAAPNQSVSSAQISSGTCQRSRIAYNPLSGDAATQDFGAALFGDCTMNWQPPAVASRSADRPAAAIRIGSPRRGAGRQLRFPVSLPAGTAFRGLELTLRYDPAALQVLGIHRSGVARDAIIAANTAEPGLIRIALASGSAIVSRGGPILTLRFEGGDPSALRHRARAAAVRLDESDFGL